MLFLPTLLAFGVALVGAQSRTSPPSGSLVVGDGGKYKKIQDAVNALSTSSTQAQSIFIQPGTYKEQVLVPSLKGLLTIYGSTTEASSYQKNLVILTGSLSQQQFPNNNDATATLRVHTSAGFKLYNVQVQNTFGQGSQALALSANAGNQGYYGCQFTGFQDTVLAETGMQVYAKTYIEGATDFIFGQSAAAWFDQCDIRIPTASLGYVTASGRASASSSYYVINRSTIAAKSGASFPKGSFYLGRPWRNYARVVVQYTSLSEVINAAGWSIWNKGDERSDHVSFGEYQNSGAGSQGTRASFSSKLSKPVQIADILGSGYATANFVDTQYLE